MIINVTDKNFKEKVIEKSEEIPVVVDFWSEWCPPCNILGPILEKIAEEQKEKFILAKANTEQTLENSRKYGIESIPNIKMFKNGKLVNGFIGAIPESDVREWFNKNLE